MANISLNWTEFLKGVEVGRRLKYERMKQSQQQWELLYEGQLTTSEKLDVENGYRINIPFDINTPILSEAGEGIRLTINGVSKIYTTTVKVSLGTEVSIGNKWLTYLDNSVGVEDDGDDFYLDTLRLIGYDSRLYTRYPGTYNVKIEKAVSEPTQVHE